MTLTSRIMEYVAAHPACGATGVSQALAAPKTSVAPILSQLRRRVDRHIKTPGRNLSKGAARKFGTPNIGSAEKIYEELGVKQPGISGVRANGKGNRWFQDGAATHGSKSNARKAASAMIARIPFPLAQYIAKVFKPEQMTP